MKLRRSVLASLFSVTVGLASLAPSAAMAASPAPAPAPVASGALPSPILGGGGGGVTPMGASGCSWAPGPTGANFCLLVDGTGLQVTGATATYQAGGNICFQQAQFRYTEIIGFGQYTQTIGPSSGCSLFSAATLLTGTRTMANGSSFCARVQNSETSGYWTSWVCETITT